MKTFAELDRWLAQRRDLTILLKSSSNISTRPVYLASFRHGDKTVCSETDTAPSRAIAKLVLLWEQSHEEYDELNDLGVSDDGPDSTTEIMMQGRAR